MWFERCYLCVMCLCACPPPPATKHHHQRHLVSPPPTHTHHHHNTTAPRPSTRTSPRSRPRRSRPRWPRSCRGSARRRRRTCSRASKKALFELEAAPSSTSSSCLVASFLRGRGAFGVSGGGGVVVGLGGGWRGRGDGGFVCPFLSFSHAPPLLLSHFFSLPWAPLFFSIILLLSIFSSCERIRFPPLIMDTCQVSQN